VGKTITDGLWWYGFPISSVVFDVALSQDKITKFDQNQNEILEGGKDLKVYCPPYLESS
jgi:hypothetical protein